MKLTAVSGSDYQFISMILVILQSCALCCELRWDARGGL